MAKEIDVAAVRQELIDFQTARNMPDRAISKAIGYSPTALSQFRNDKYTGDDLKVAEALRSFLDIQKKQKAESEQPTKLTTFVETSVSKRLFEVATMCHVSQEMGVAYGAPGLGKTSAAKAYVEEYPSTILIESYIGYTSTVLLQEIASRLNIEPHKKMHYNFGQCVERLKDTNRLLIIDEAEYLRYETLELVRRIHDMSNIGVLLVGLPRLIENLRGRRGEYAMLSSRIGVSASLQNLRYEDTEQLVKTVIPDANGLCKIYHECSNGNARVLNKLISRSLRVASINEVKVNAEVVREASKLLIL